MTAMWLAFEALDVLFFRDGRPFIAGEAHWARSRFPPPPETMLGATRALFIDAYLRTKDLTLQDYAAWVHRADKRIQRTFDTTQLQALAAAEGYFGPRQSLDLAGPFLLDPDGEVVVPAPRDVMRRPPDGTTTDTRLLALRPLVVKDNLLGDARWNDGAGAGGQRPRPLTTDAHSLEELEGVTWLRVKDLKSYLTTGQPNAAAAGKLSDSETRTGIALQPSRIVHPGYFYRVDVVRPAAKPAAQQCGAPAQDRTRILVRVNDPSGKIDETKWRIPLGGEARVAAVRKLDPAADGIDGQLGDLLDHPDELRKTIIDTASRTGWLRAVLLQPAVFRTGWVPDSDEFQPNGDLIVNGHRFTLESAAIDKPVSVSGWDLAANKQKPLRRAVAAGAVYHFKMDENVVDRREAAAAFFDHLHATARMQADTESAKAGYGLSVVGACEPLSRP